VLRSRCVVGFALFVLTVASQAQSNPDALTSYFTGKEAVLKIDMPGTQQGVDLRFDKDNPMNWKEYSNRLKSNGVSIRKGDTARVTSFVVKSDRIELQLDGGGFGTFFDDSSSTVAAQSVDKSDYEKQLQKQIDNTTDPDRKRQLERDLDRERSRRERQEDSNRAAAQIASQIKAQKVASQRLQGGSRFNLRWSGAIPSDQKNPDAVMKLMADYLSFPGPPQTTASPAAPPQTAAAGGDIPATAQLRRGMKIEEVTTLLGPGQQLSQSVSGDGLKTQVMEYMTADRRVDVTYVEGLVVRYSISSN
jgi:hypothetical protein